MSAVLNVLTHRHVYLVAMIMMAVGLPLSMFLMSVSAIALGARWVLGRVVKGDWKSNFSRFWSNKAAVILSSLYILHLIGLLYTTDFDYAMKDLRIKLPLLFLPLVFSTMPKLSRKHFDMVLWFFISATVISSLISVGVLIGWIDRGFEIKDTREIVFFISHIRFSLFVCLSIFFLFWQIGRSKGWLRVLSGILILYLIYFLYLLGSPTGMVVLLFGILAILMYWSWTSQSRTVKAVATALFIVLPLGAFFYVRSAVHNYYDVNPVDLAQLEQYSAGGEQYHHDPKNRQIENGNYVWIYVAWGELKRTWDRRSAIPYDSLDHSGQYINGTLIRYLTSKGLRKDSLGVMALDEKDIHLIENGVANHNMDAKHGIAKRLAQIIFEFDVYLNGGNPSGNSITQKLEFWSTARYIISNNFWIGVGTGDVQKAFDQAYQETNSILDEEVRFRAHNQYLTMFITFGVIGFLWFIFTLIAPPLLLRKQFDYYYLMFFLCAILSFLSEDTLETQAGLTFFAFFSNFLLFARQDAAEAESE